MEHVYLPPEVIALQREITSGYHPRLTKLLAGVPEGDKLEVICTYCDVLVDGYFTANDINQLCGKLTEKLMTLRESPGGILLVN